MRRFCSTAISGYHTDPNEESKAKKYDILIKETIPFYMGRLDKQVEENEGFFVNGKVSTFNEVHPISYAMLSVSIFFFILK